MSLQRGENIEERAGADKIEPAQAPAIDPDLAALDREGGEAPEGVVGRPAELALERERLRISRRRLVPLRRGRPGCVAATFPGRRRLLEGHRILDRDILETCLVAGVLQQFEQHQPGVARPRRPGAHGLRQDVGERTHIDQPHLEPLRGQPGKQAAPDRAARIVHPAHLGDVDTHPSAAARDAGELGELALGCCRELPAQVDQR